MNNLPQYPIILFIFINLKLRDYYYSLDLLCQDLNINKEELIKKLANAGFEYNIDNNKFRDYKLNCVKQQ